MPSSEELRFALVDGRTEEEKERQMESIRRTTRSIKNMSATLGTSSYKRVKEFHEAFGHPVADRAEVPSDDRTRLRLALILEEALELADAMGFYTQEAEEAINKMVNYGPVAKGNLVGIADALGDLDYVVNGAALEHGINLPAVTAEIHRSNMTKLGPDGKPIYREDGKILKGEGYEPPNLEDVLGV